MGGFRSRGANPSAVVTALSRLMVTCLLVATAQGGCSDSDQAGEADGSVQDSRISGDAETGAGPDLEQTDLPRLTSCDGIDCGGEGTCVIGQDGFARCDCNECRYPDPKNLLRCLPIWEICSEAGLTCNGSSACTVDVDACTCEPYGDPVPVCGCKNGYIYDGTDCKPDVEGCRSLETCKTSTPERYSLKVTGDVTVTIVDRAAYGSDYDWTWQSLKLYNDWPSDWCGAVTLKGPELAAGTHQATSVDLTVGYGEQAWSTTSSGASGSVVVNDWTWCAEFDCTTVDLTVDATLADGSGSLISVVGFIKSVF